MMLMFRSIGLSHPLFRKTRLFLRFHSFRLCR